MSVTNFPSRAQIEQAGDLDFAAARSAAGTTTERMPILLELAPDGLHIRVEYTGTLASIPAAVKRLMDAGLVELVQTYRATPTAAPAAGAGQVRKPKAERVTPEFNGAGDPCCPVHKMPLLQGRFGSYCSAKAKPGEAQNDKGYCSIRFSE